MEKLSEKKLKEDPLYQECLEKAEGNEIRALAIYRYRTSDQQKTIGEDLDQKEKWPMQLVEDHDKSLLLMRKLFLFRTS